jgi:hypothetical protein
MHSPFKIKTETITATNNNNDGIVGAVNDLLAPKIKEVDAAFNDADKAGTSGLSSVALYLPAILQFPGLPLTPASSMSISHLYSTMSCHRSIFRVTSLTEICHEKTPAFCDVIGCNTLLINN